MLPTLCILGAYISRATRGDEKLRGLRREDKPMIRGSLTFVNCMFAVMGLGLTYGVAPAVAAGDQPAAKLDEIIVTATKREETLHDVPITVDVFTGGDIERRNIIRPADFLNSTANVNLIQAVRPGEADVSMRGIQGNFGLTQPVAVVVDGVVEANPNALDQELIGVDHIEVVKGPQSALYGRNANAGAIIINTVRPTDQVEGKIVVGAGNGNSVKAQALISGPIWGDKLVGRLALSHTDADGYWKNKTVGRPSDPHKEQIADARVIFEPNDALSIDLRGKVSKLKEGAQLWDVQIPPFIAVDNNNYFPQFQANNAIPARQTRYDFSGKLDYKMPVATLTIIGSHDKYRMKYFADGALHTLFPGGPPTIFVDPAALFDATPPLLPGYSYAINDGNAFGQLNETDSTFEMRLISPSDQKLRWFFGGYYAESRRMSYSDTRVDTGAGIIPEILGDTLNPASSNPLIQIGQYYVEKGEDKAVFGQLSYDPLQKVTLEVSLRYDEETKSNKNLIPAALSPITGLPLTDPVLAPSGLLRKATYTKLQPKYTIRYLPTDDVTLFASYGIGFRSGGFNGAGTGKAVQLQAPNTNFPDAFPSETSDAYELGFKTKWFDDRLRVSGSLFYTDIDNAQAFTAFPNPPITIVISLKKARAQGFELEGSYALTDGLTISDSFGLTDTKIRRTELASALGKKIPGTPDFTNSLSLDYSRPLPAALTLLSHLEWQEKGRTWFDVYNTAGTQRDSFSLVNMRVAIEGELKGNTWQIAAWANNLLDQHYNIYAAPVPPLANFSYRAEPRMFGVDVSYKF